MKYTTTRCSISIFKARGCCFKFCSTIKTKRRYLGLNTKNGRLQLLSQAGNQNALAGSQVPVSHTQQEWTARFAAQPLWPSYPQVSNGSCFAIVSAVHTDTSTIRCVSIYFKATFEKVFHNCLFEEYTEWFCVDWRQKCIKKVNLLTWTGFFSLLLRSVVWR